MGSGRAVGTMAALGLAIACAWGGCAQVGPVLPPSAGIPALVRDFTAQRRGAVVQLAWTPPTRTSDGVALSPAHLPLRYQLCVWPGANNTTAACPGARALAGSGPPAAVPLPQLTPPGATGLVTLALGVDNSAGISAGWSNRVSVPLTPVAPAPALETATPSPDGVHLRWIWPPQPAGAPAPAAVVIYRDGTAIATLPAGPAGAPGAYLDRSVAVGQHYQYWLRSAAGAGAARVISVDSAHLQVDTADVFPPPAPAGVQAVTTAAAVELSWNPSPARDLAGYNVYRKAGNGPWQKRNPELVLTPAFLDTAAPPGASYAVTAVDQAGHESPRSTPVAPR